MQGQLSTSDICMSLAWVCILSWTPHKSHIGLFSFFFLVIALVLVLLKQGITQYVTTAVLEFVAILPQPSKFWDSRYELPDCGQLVTAHFPTPPHLCHLLSWYFFPRPARYARCCCQTNVVSVHTSGFMPTSPPTAARSVVSSVALPTSRLT